MAVVIGIILTILKFFGIALLVILGLVLLILLVLLFAPFKYSFTGAKDNKFEVDTKITWLFSIISVQYILKDGIDDVIVKIPFYSMYSKENNKKQKHKWFGKKNKSDNAHNNSSGQVAAESNISAINIVQNKYDDNENGEEKYNLVEKTFNKNNEEFFDKMWYNKFKEFIISIKDKFKSFISVLKEIAVNVIKYKNIANEFDMEFGIKRTITPTFIAIKRLLKSLKPNKFEVNGVIGLEDPADTGILMGILGTITPYLPGNFYVYGDFEKSVIKGDVYIKGRTNLLLILIPVLRYIFKKPILDIIKKYWR